MKADSPFLHDCAFKSVHFTSECERLSVDHGKLCDVRVKGGAHQPGSTDPVSWSENPVGPAGAKLELGSKL